MNSNTAAVGAQAGAGGTHGHPRQHAAKSMRRKRHRRDQTVALRHAAVHKSHNDLHYAQQCTQAPGRVGVRRRTGVERVEALAGGAAVDAVALDQAHEDDLAAEDGEDALRVDEAGVAEVVQAILLEHLRACRVQRAQRWNQVMGCTQTRRRTGCGCVNRHGSRRVGGVPIHFNANDL